MRRRGIKADGSVNTRGERCWGERRSRISGKKKRTKYSGLQMVGKWRHHYKLDEQPFWWGNVIFTSGLWWLESELLVDENLQFPFEPPSNWPPVVPPPPPSFNATTIIVRIVFFTNSTPCPRRYVGRLYSHQTASTKRFASLPVFRIMSSFLYALRRYTLPRS